jgi:hypothetical protein
MLAAVAIMGFDQLESEIRSQYVPTDVFPRTGRHQEVRGHCARITKRVRSHAMKRALRCPGSAMRAHSYSPGSSLHQSKHPRQQASVAPRLNDMSP